MRWRSLLVPFRRSPDAPPQRSDTATMRRMRRQVFVATTFGYGFFYVCRLSFNVVKKPLVDAGVFDAAQLGVIGSALFVAYAAGRLVNGVLVDHANVKRFMATGLLASALVNLALGTLPSFWTFVALWAANGWVQAMGAPASVVAIGSWFTAKRRGTVYGVWSTSHNIGEALTWLVTGAIVAAAGAAWGFRAAGSIGVAASLFVLWMLHERPEVHGFPPPPGTVVHAAARRPVAALQWKVARDPRIWLLATASGLFYVTRYAINSWGVFFLQEAKGYPLADAAALLSINALAGIAGTFFSGIASDRLFDGDRYRPALIAGVLLVASTALFLFGPADAVRDNASMVLFGVATGALLAYLGGMMALDLVDRAAVGTATAIVGVASYVGAALQDVTSGWLIHASRASSEHGGYDFTIVAWLWVGAAVLSCVATQLVRLLSRGE